MLAPSKRHPLSESLQHLFYSSVREQPGLHELNLILIFLNGALMLLIVMNFTSIGILDEAILRLDKTIIIALMGVYGFVVLEIVGFLFYR